MSIDDLWHAKHLVDSAFHPDTGERMNFMGRMSFQVPGGMAITGAMLQWYRSVLYSEPFSIFNCANSMKN